jgi:hypothetical protein
MEARKAIHNASYGPSELKALGEAFDDAWLRVAPSISSRAAAVDAARLKLADILLALAKQGNFDPKWLADTAVHMMTSQP